MDSSRQPRVKRFVGFAVITVAIVIVISGEIGPFPPFGILIDPHSGLWYVPGNSNLPGREEVTVSGIDGEITVIRDEWGVPHIFAETDNDAYFAVGYCHAQDRLWQMDIQRRQFNGELSEIIGTAAIGADILYRSIGLGRVAKENWEYIKVNNGSSDFVQAIESYTAGINAHIDSLSPKDYPVEFKLLNYKPQQWREQDTLGWQNMMSWSLSGQSLFYELIMSLYSSDMYFGSGIINELYPVQNTYNVIPVIPDNGTYFSGDLNKLQTVDQDDFTTKLANSRKEDNNLPVEMIEPVNSIINLLDQANQLSVLGHSIGDFIPGVIGSNNWVVNGSKTESGYPLLANDMHLSHGIPPIWYEIHYSSVESGMNVYGFSFIGGPGVIAGHNDYCAWGFTNGQVDVVDAYYYMVNPENGDQFWNDTENGYTDFLTTTEIIKIKNAAAYNLTVKFTDHGGVKCPVLPTSVYPYSEINTTYPGALSMRWTGLDTPNYLFKAVHDFTKMRNLEEFKEAGKYWQTPGQNTVYADIYGNIAIRPVGSFPVRPEGYWGRIICNGSANEGEWLGYIPYDELPVSENPEQGYYASTNQYTAGPDYPYFLGSFFDEGYRSKRINEILNGTGTGTGGTFTVDDMIAAQSDNIDTCAMQLVPTAISINPASNETLMLEAVDYLEDWDFDMDKDAVAPTIWWVWVNFYTNNIFNDEKENVNFTTQFHYPQYNVIENLTIHNSSVTWFDDVSTHSVVETVEDIALKSMKNTVNYLSSNLGSDASKWLWGDIHKLYVRHLGGISTLSPPAYRWDGDQLTLNAASGLTTVTSGPSERVIYDLSKLKERTLDGILHSSIAISCIPGGQRGWALSDHYTDQLEELWLEYKYHDSWFTNNLTELLAIEDDLFKSESTLILKPEGDV